MYVYLIIPIVIFVVAYKFALKARATQNELNNDVEYQESLKTIMRNSIEQASGEPFGGHVVTCHNIKEKKRYRSIKYTWATYFFNFFPESKRMKIYLFNPETEEAALEYVVGWGNTEFNFKEKKDKIIAYKKNQLIGDVIKQSANSHSNVTLSFLQEEEYELFKQFLIDCEFLK